MHPVPLCNVTDIVAGSIITHIYNSIRTIHMTATYFKIITIASRLRISNNNHAAISSEVRLDDISRIILVGSKVALNMAALVKVLGSYTIVNA